MKQFNGKKPINKGRFGYDISNSISNQQINCDNNKEFKPVTNKVNFCNPYSKEESAFEVPNLRNMKIHIPNQPLQNEGNERDYSMSNSNMEVLEKNTIKDNNNLVSTSNDADDEGNLTSITASSVYPPPNSTFKQQIEKLNLDSESINLQNVKDFENTTQALLQLVERSREDADRNRILVQKLESELAILRKELSVTNTSKFNDSIEHTNAMIRFYNEKMEEFAQNNKESEERITEFENIFNQVQRYQSEIYQNTLFDLKSKLESKTLELQQLRKDYDLLEQWSITLFREIGNRAKTWNNREFILTVNEVAKSLKHPIKRDNLQSMYRYLMAYIYNNEINENELFISQT